MELKETAKKILDIFEVENIGELANKLPELLIRADKNSYLTQYIELVGVDGRDMLQSAYQFWLADREGKKQDYTPKSLGRLVAALGGSNASIIFDACAGSGALTIACWEQKPELKFVCWEMDKQVIGFLLLNLALRNITATVINGDLLTGEICKCYNVEPGKQFSGISQIEPVIPKCDLVISNPPFNLKWKAAPFGFNGKILQPPASNANYAFILKSLVEANTDRGIFILPAGTITPNSKAEVECRDALASDKMIKAIVYNVGDMFESTSVRTQCLMIEPNSENVSFVDNGENFAIEIREQRGENHMTNRVYKKKLKVYDNACIERVVNAISNKESVPGFCNTVSIEKAIECKFDKASIIERVEYKTEYRSIGDIVNDLNRIYEEKNKLKLTVNENIAKRYNLLEAANLQSAQNLKEANKLLKNLGADELAGDKYLTLSKNAGEFKFENKNKQEVSTIIEQILPLYVQHIRFLNAWETQYLEELRTVLIELLMSGRVDLENLGVDV